MTTTTTPGTTRRVAELEPDDTIRVPGHHRPETVVRIHEQRRGRRLIRTNTNLHLLRTGERVQLLPELELVPGIGYIRGVDDEAGR